MPIHSIEMEPENIDLSVKPEAVEEQPHQKGHKIWPETYSLTSDEPALLLVERNEQSPDFSGFRRYQTIFVARNDKLAKFMADMGPEIGFTSSPFSIPGGDPKYPASEWYHTVEELQEFANDMREFLLRKEYEDGKRQAPPLIDQYAVEVEQNEMTRKGKRWHTLPKTEVSNGNAVR